MEPLPLSYQTRMERLLGADFPRYMAAMQKPPVRSIRLNPIKTTADAFAALTNRTLRPNGIEPNGFLLDQAEAVGRHPLHAAGLFYVQEASAQFPVTLFSDLRDAVVLDLCAAPGGKTTQLAARMENGGVLFANEYVASRANVLMGNVERLGVGNAIITNHEPAVITARLEGLCDAVLVDAPCAGEGMFRKDPEAMRAWSQAHVETCAARQRGILNDAARAVKRGGELVYSTCSFSEEENEQTVLRFLKTHPDFSLVSMHRLYPHTCAGEGQFAALFVREGNRLSTPRKAERHDRCPEWESFSSESLRPFLSEGVLRALKDGRLIRLPPLPCPLDGLRIVRGGLLLGERKPNRFEPSHALALYGGKTPFLHTEALSEEEAARYLKGDAIPRAAVKGYLAVTYRDHALGLAKASDGLLKNRYPKGLRLP